MTRDSDIDILVVERTAELGKARITLVGPAPLRSTKLVVTALAIFLPICQGQMPWPTKLVIPAAPKSVPYVPTPAAPQQGSGSSVPNRPPASYTPPLVNGQGGNAAPSANQPQPHPSYTPPVVGNQHPAGPQGTPGTGKPNGHSANAAGSAPAPNAATEKPAPPGDAGKPGVAAAHATNPASSGAESPGPKNGRTDLDRGRMNESGDSGNALDHSASRALLDEVNRSLAGIQGLNGRALPPGDVLVRPNGELTVTDGGGGKYELRGDGTIASFQSGSLSASFNIEGGISALHTPTLDMRIGVSGGRTLVTRLPDDPVLVGIGPGRGYLERSVATASGTIVQRTYVSGSGIHTQVFSMYSYQGVAPEHFVPAAYYAPAFYGWAYYPWAEPVAFDWGWANEPWYRLYSPYFRLASAESRDQTPARLAWHWPGIEFLVRRNPSRNESLRRWWWRRLPADGIIRGKLMPSPTICIDCSPLLVRSAGVKTYLYHWLNAMRALNPGAIRTFLAPAGSDRVVHDGGIRKYPIQIAALQSLNRLPSFVCKMMAPQCDFFHPSNLLRKIPERHRLTATVHDLTTWIFPECHTTALISADKAFAERVLKCADGLIAVSESTKQDAVRILGIPPERIRVIHPGIPPEYSSVSPESISRVAASYSLRRAYFLSVGTIEPRKNIDTLLSAWQGLPDTFRREHELIVVGMPGWNSGATVKRLAQANREDRGIRYLGYVDERDLPALTAGASAFVYPSLYEGFGIPVAQAMAAGCPVITSNVSSLPEITDGAAILIDPRSVAELIAAMRRIGESPDLAARLNTQGIERARKFNWETAASESLRYFAEIA